MPRVSWLRIVPLCLVLACEDEDGKPSDTDARDTEVADSEVPETDTQESDAHSDETDAPSGARLEASGVVECQNPNARQDRYYDRLQLPVPAARKKYLAGAGSAIADLDDDGRLDYVLVSETQVVLAWQGAGNMTLRETLLTVAAPDDDTFGLFGPSVADYDGDGDLDLIVTGYGIADHLWRNDGGRRFTEVTRDAGLVHADDYTSTGTTWHDVDGDGDLDLLIGGHGVLPEGQTDVEIPPGRPSLLYVNQGDGTFVDETERIDPSVQRGLTFSNTFLDVDGDGDDDLYQMNDFGAFVEPCRLLWNDGTGHFTADGDVWGADANVAGMGLAVGDYDNDGDEDFGVVAFNRTRFWNVSPEGLFETAQTMGWWPVGRQSVGWGSELADTNNDGRLDLSTAWGFLDSTLGGANNGPKQPDGLYVQKDHGVFVDQAEQAGLADVGTTRSHNWADVNGDGWLDLLRVTLDGEAWLDRARCGTQSWVTVTLRQPGPNVFGIGATVRVQSNGVTRLRRLRAGGTGYATGGPPVVHFGLGNAETVDVLEVTWPDGHVTTFEDVAARQHLTVRED